MIPLVNPMTWIPYGNNKDCSQRFCNNYCPQWCYIVYPAPPPPYKYPNDDSNPKFSPIVIAIIGILVTAFLLLTYYIIISKYCTGHRESTHRSHNPNSNDQELQEHEPFHASTKGLDESLIKSIVVSKYNKFGNSFVGVTECSVCLSEFQDDESVRILPNCNHSFHLPCIDTWLKSNSSCPLCRARIIFAAFNDPAASVIELPSIDGTSSENYQHVGNENIDVVVVGGGGINEFGVVQEVNMHYSGFVSKPTLRAFSDLSNNVEGRHRIIEIRDEVNEFKKKRDEVNESIRSMSLDHSIQSGVLVGKVNQEEDFHHILERCSMDDVGPSKRSSGESSKSSYKKRVLHCVMSPIAMKRSVSRGRFSFGKIDRRRQGFIHV